MTVRSKKVGGLGESNYRWRGGRAMDGKYISIKRLDGGRVREHVLVAERVLGRPLPNGAEVHHVNGNGRDNRTSNLVICESKSYHRLLHVRMASYLACGDPNKRKCIYCQHYDDIVNMKRPLRTFYHGACHARRAREERARKRGCSDKT
jgi:hypothetical protein